MNFNLRKILFFINITLIILIISVLGFAFYRNKKDTMRLLNDTNKNQPKIIQSLPQLLADQPVIGLDIEEFSGKIKFYSLESGALYEVLPGEQPKLISNPQLNNVQQITWSPDNLKVFVSAGGRKYIYDFIAQKSYPLNGNIQDSLVFSPNSQKILYQFKNQKENIISVADYTGQNYAKVISSPIFEAKLNWTLNGAYLWQKSEKNFSASLYLIDIVPKTIAKILDNILGLDTVPSGSGLKFIYQEYINDDLSLYVYNFLEKNIIKLPFKTEANKCIFSQSEEEIFCALSDKIINYNLKTKKEAEVTKIDFNVFNLQLTPDEKYLIFQDKQSKKPYYLKIK